ncbi:MAG: C10 family peptidase [Candidatus Neomarinimicrobiota bacterium]
MKCKQRLSLYLLVIVSQLFLQAEVQRSTSFGTVTQELAQDAARAFLVKEQSAPPRVAAKTPGEFIVSNEAAGLSVGKIQPIRDEHGETLAYVQHLEPKGFIILSADDVGRKVLGFSFSGEFSFDHRGANPLLDLVIADVSARRGLTSIGKEERTKVAYSTQWGPWLQTHWNQTEHWNDKCPYLVPNVPGVRRFAGCVAIALAQIANYWKYPNSMSFGSLEDPYQSGDINVFDDAGQYGFPTASELNTALESILYNGNSDEEAYFTFGIGVKVKMNYGITGSGAYSRMAARALRDELHYGSTVYQGGELVWENYRDDVIRNMKDGWPVYLGISAHWLPFMGGHAVVMDGYRESDGYFHINLGWEFPSLWNVWYDLPDIAGYSLIDEVIFDIAEYQGWSQYGADAQNTFSSVYPAPDSITQKWRATTGSEGFAFSDILIGTSSQIFAAVSATYLQGNAHPYVYVIDQFGTTLQQIEISRDGNIEFMSQSQDGDLFVAMEGGFVYRVDPDQGSAVEIFQEPNGDDVYTLKIDEEGWLFPFTDLRMYALTESGSSHWSAPFIVPSNTIIFPAYSIPAIDLSRNRIYVTYYNTDTKHAHLASLNRLNGEVVETRDLGELGLARFRSASLSNDGTVYIHIPNVTLGEPGTTYALNPDDLLGAPFWTKSLLGGHLPAVARDGTLYVSYWEQIGSIWYNVLGALDPSTGETLWTQPFQLDEAEESIFQPYVAGNGVVLFAIEHDGSPKTYTIHAYKDNETSTEELWQYDAGTSGGDFAFGPGRTVYAWGKAGLAQTIHAISAGDVGDPFGAGMNFENNTPPVPASNPSPGDGTEDLDTASVQLSWTSSDPDGHSLKYDIYICALIEGQEAAFVPVATGITENSYTITGLLPGTQHLWSVVATDGQAISEGPTWSFSTGGVLTVDVTIPLKENWNLVSWNVDTENDSIEVLLDEIMDNVDVVLGFDDGAQTYDPDLPQFSDLDVMDHLHGYWIKMAQSDTLTVTGTSVNPQTPIDLDAGWNLVSYLPNVSYSVDHALESVFDNIIVVLGFDEGGLTYDPELPGFSDLQVLSPTFGYWVKLSEEDILIYPGTRSAGGAVSLAKKGSLGKSDRGIVPTNGWISLYGEGIRLDGELLPAGIEITAVDEDGVTCGAFIVSEAGRFGFMPIYRDDPRTEIDEGPRKDEEVAIYFGDYEVPVKVVWTEFGDIVDLGDLLLAAEDGMKNLPTEYGLSQNYPNPFNPVTTIRYQIPNDGNVTVEVYDLLGREVVTLVEGFQRVGYYSAVWNGRDEFGKEVGSGVYIYQMSSGEFVQTRKLVVVK